MRFLISHAGRYRILECIMEVLTAESSGKSVTIFGLESELVVQQAWLVSRVASVRDETQGTRSHLDSKVTVFNGDMATARAYLSRGAEEVTVLTQVLEEKSKQG